MTSSGPGKSVTVRTVALPPSLFGTPGVDSGHTWFFPTQKLFTATGAEKVITIESPWAKPLGNPVFPAEFSNCSPVMAKGATMAKSELVAEPYWAFPE